MARKQEAVRAMNKVGATHEDDGTMVWVDAPKGQIFGGESHFRCYDYYRGDKASVWESLIEDLESLGQCPEPDCEHCCS